MSNIRQILESRDIRSLLLDGYSEEEDMYSKDKVIERFVKGDFESWRPTWGIGRARVTKIHDEDVHKLYWDGKVISTRYKDGSLSIEANKNNRDELMMANRIKRMAKRLGVIVRDEKEPYKDFRVGMKVATKKHPERVFGEVVDRRWVPEYRDIQTDWELYVPIKFFGGGYGAVEKDSLEILQ